MIHDTIQFKHVLFSLGVVSEQERGIVFPLFYFIVVKFLPKAENEIDHRQFYYPNSVTLKCSSSALKFCIFIKTIDDFN